MLLVCLAAPAPAVAQELWGEIELPGGAARARQMFSLGLPEDRPDGAWLADYLKREFSGTPVLTLLSLEEYLTALEQARTAIAELPDGLTLQSAAGAPAERTRIMNALRALGLTATRRGNQLHAERDPSRDAATRQMALERAGVDLDELALTLNAGRRAAVSLHSSRLPLPLPDYWRARVFSARLAPLLTITGSREHSLLYLALLALNDSTLAFLQARPHLIARLSDGPLAAFAAFGRSLRIQNGAIDVPGGADAAAVWRELVGRDPGDAEAFIPELFARDDGRLAYFYDTVAHLTPDRQQFVLGHGLETGARVRLAQRIAARFGRGPARWDVERLPFHRPPFDPAVALMLIDVRPDGSIGPPWLPALLESAMRTEAWPARPERVFASRGIADVQAPWLIDWLFEKPAESEIRFGLLRFRGRRSGSASPGPVQSRPCSSSWPRTAASSRTGSSR